MDWIQLPQDKNPLKSSSKHGNEPCIPCRGCRISVVKPLAASERPTPWNKESRHAGRNLLLKAEPLSIQVKATYTFIKSVLQYKLALSSVDCS